MKCSLPLFGLCLLAGGFTAQGQLPRQHSLSLDAVAIAAGSSTQTSQGTTASTSKKASKSTGDFSHSLRTTQTQTIASKEAVQISVRNFGPLPDTARVEWYFIAAPAVLEPGKSLFDQQYAFDQGTKDLSLAGNGAESFPVESEEITSSVQRRNSSRLSTSTRSSKSAGRAGAPAKQTGAKLNGWVVRVVADGKVVATKGSSQGLEDIAKDEAKLKDLIAK